MSTLSRRSYSVPAATTAGFALAIPGLALAHETGVPHGAAEHMALYLGAAAVLALLGVAIAAFTGKKPAERRVRVERDARRDSSRR